MQNVYSCYYPTDQSLEWPTVQRNDSRTIDLASYFLAAQYAAWKSRQSEVEAWAWKRGERDWFAETKWSTVFLRTLPDMTLVQARRQSCRTPFSLPLFCPFAKTQVFFFFLQTTHSLLYSCLPWFLTELPTLPTGPSNSCIRFFFLFFVLFCCPELRDPERKQEGKTLRENLTRPRVSQEVRMGGDGREKRTKYGCHFTNQVEGQSPLSCRMPRADGAH